MTPKAARKLLKATRINRTSTPRPRLTLPKDHAFNLALNQLDGVPIGPNEDGIYVTCWYDNEKAKSVVAEKIPQALTMVTLDGRRCGFMDWKKTNKGFEFEIVTATFDAPSADDPQRLESGWAATMLTGPIWQIQKYYDFALSSLKESMTGTITQLEINHPPA